MLYLEFSKTVENGFAEFYMQSLNLVFVQFCKILVGGLNSNLATIKENRFYNRVQYFEPDLNWDVQLHVPFDGLKSLYCVVSPVIQSLGEGTCGIESFSEYHNFCLSYIHFQGPGQGE